MKIVKYILYILILVLFISCNASILMTNGEITQPDNNRSDDNDSTSVFSFEAPEHVYATKSYFQDSISVRWDAVKGADYYTLEKTSHTTEKPSSNATWSSINETVSATSYSDKLNLEKNTYYSYRITAHTLSGEYGDTSESTTGTILASPISLDASKGTSDSSIIVTWDQMPNVKKYKIYKATVSSVSGLSSEYITTVNATTDTQNVYSYDVKDTEKGSALYFAIKGVGATGNEADISDSRYGYTKVAGAPSKPEVIVSKGASATEIKIQFKSSGDDTGYDYIIKRSNPGSSERDMFNTTAHDTLPEKNESGYYEYIDSEVNPNVEYTYSVIAQNETGMSQAGVETGYLLSPIQSIELVANKDKMGYEILITLPLGADDSERTIPYTYTVIETNQDNVSTSPVSYSEEEFAEYVATKVFEVYSKEEYTAEKGKEEILRINVVVSNETDSTDSVSSNIISPPVVKAVTASEYNKPYDKDVANSNGVFPIYVSWTWEIAPKAVQTLVRVGSDGSNLVIENAGTNSYSDNSGTVPFITYTYKIKATDVFGREFGDYVSSNAGYGALSADIFIDIFESVSLKPWDTSRQKYLPDEYKSYWTNSKIGKLVGYGNASDLSTQMKALDSADDNDHFRKGKITYSASTEGVGGQIYFTYNNFGENANFYMTGNYEMHVNSSGTGSCASNTSGFEVNGMYPASISLSKVSIVKKAFSGKYSITFKYSNGTGKGEVQAK